METIAIYYEEHIKTYGFESRSGLVLWRIVIRGERVDGWAQAMSSLSREGVAFHLAHGHWDPDAGWRAVLVVDACHSEVVGREATAAGLEGRFTEPVDLLHFRGPHFGDRYGILASALSALERGGVPVWTSACSASSIYLVLPPGSTPRAREALTPAFIVPAPARRSRGGQRSK